MTSKGKPKNEKRVVKYKLISDDGFITATLRKTKKLQNPILFKEIAYTRIDAKILRKLIQGKTIIDIALCKSPYASELLLRIDDKLLAPNISDFRSKEDFEIGIVCPRCHSPYWDKDRGLI